MPEERRQTSLDAVLVTLGSLQATSTDTNTKVHELDTKVGIQNGRIGALELQRAAQDGFIRGLTILVSVLIVPVVMIVLTQVIGKLHF